MHTLMFIVASLLLFLSFFNFVAAFLDDPFPPCNGSVPLFPESKGEEIHALLPRDRYINFVGWIPGIKEYQRLGPEKIPYGYLKEMLLHFESISDEGYLEARIFLTSMEKNETIYLHEIYSCNHNMKDKSWEHDYETHDYCPLREQFIKFKIFKDEKYDANSGEEWAHHYDPHGCHKYAKEYSNIDGLLIEINCKTTEVIKILVKCEPY
uniref:Uncharacterized protein n=1 Tax=Panagrolaimus davidi TaxID=227884 RepID=A0A914QGR3_9BILA